MDIRARSAQGFLMLYWLALGTFRINADCKSHTQHNIITYYTLVYIIIMINSPGAIYSSPFRSQLPLALLNR